ncbi:MAG: hypothetical protein ACUVRZ_03545 [Desulfobacca sp.]|uniref:hypothetical protein n=1 Tax=Desulfobacca sp. TaxID=2067990 RepID=UPI004049E39B
MVMWELFNGQTEVLVEDGFLYVPLLLDVEIAAALQAGEGEGGAAAVVDIGSGVRGDPSPPAVPLRQRGESYFIQALSLDALVEGYQAVFPQAYAQLRLALLQDILPRWRACQPWLDPTLKTILFEVLPYFLRTRRGKHREQADAKAFLAYVAASQALPTQAGPLLAAFQEQMASLREVLQWLTARQAAVGDVPPPPGSAAGLRQWLQTALQARILAQEIRRGQEELAARQAWADLPAQQLALLLAIAAQGAVAVADVGFFRDPKRPGVYWVYKRSGAFVLQDYYGRPYLFPDCRVAVCSAGPYQPVVWDTYKHPLLRRWAPRQPICLTDYQAPQEFSATAMIRALQEGLNALYYGYNSRKRNGYNSLDDYGRHRSLVTFADWRLPPDDPRLLRGELEVKNR